MTEAAAARSVSTFAAEPTQRADGRWIAFIALANLGLYLGYIGPISVLLPNQVQAIAGPAHKVVVLGWVTGIGAAVAMVANPVAGALSDRTTSRFGRRHPWIVCGALAGAAGRAKDLGIINIANSGPQVLAPALAAPLVTQLGGYPALYLFVAACTVLGSAFVWRIRSVP